MDQKKLFKIGGLANILAGIVLPLWWISMGLFLPVAEAKDNFDLVIKHPNWIPVNLLGFVGVLAWALSFLPIYFYRYDNRRTMGFIGFLLGEIAIIMYACIHYYETFIWPVVAKYNPHLVKFDGALVFGDPIVLVPLVVSGVLLAVGYILLGIDLLRRRIFPRSAVWMFFVGAIIFGNGMVFVIRTIGLIPFSVAMTWIGIQLVKENSDNI